MSTTFGSYIRSLRTQNGMTQAQLADRLNVTDKAVSKWERDLSYPDITLFPKLADLLGVTADDLLHESKDGGQPSRLLQIFEMSHDIRTPLHIILGCANMARLHHEDTDLLLRYLESIQISGEYLLQVIDRVMEVTHQEQDGPEVSAKAGPVPTPPDPSESAISGSDRRNTVDSPPPSNIQELSEYLDHRAQARRDSMEKFDFSGKRILVAEDIMVNREIAGEILRHAGAEVEFAEDGQVCLDKIQKSPAGYYDLILMDLMMPVLDGLEAARRIRRLDDPEKASIPIIAVSANVHEKERREALEAGMNEFAEKPIFIDRLFAAMAKFL